MGAAGSGRSGSGERAGHAAPCRPTAPPQGIKGHPVPAQPAHKASHCRLHLSMDPEEGHATGLGGWAAPAGMAGRPAGTVPAGRAANHFLTRPCQRLLLMAAGTPGATTLRIRLPDGSTHQRRFLASDPLQVGAPSCCPACDASATAFPLAGDPPGCSRSCMRAPTPLSLPTLIRHRTAIRAVGGALPQLALQRPRCALCHSDRPLGPTYPPTTTTHPLPARAGGARLRGLPGSGHRPALLVGHYLPTPCVRRGCVPRALGACGSALLCAGGGCWRLQAQLCTRGPNPGPMLH